MDIASMSMSMHTIQLQQQVSVAVMDKAMEAQSQTASAMIEDLQVANPPSNHILDVLA